MINLRPRGHARSNVLKPNTKSEKTKIRYNNPAKLHNTGPPLLNYIRFLFFNFKHALNTTDEPPSRQTTKLYTFLVL